MNAMKAIDILRTATASYDSCFHEDGEIHDPVLGVPFQYGTPYHAVCNAVLALKGDEDEREMRLRRARKGFEASLRHVVNTEEPPPLTSVSRDTGCSGRVNHRDFFWAPVLKRYLILRDLGEDMSSFEEDIRSVEVEKSFRSSPPSNWATVWLTGEWLRMREGLSPNDIEQFDAWLQVFFDGHIDLDKGFYHEPGHPNSYDLFTRFHLADILREGYDGRLKAEMERLLKTGLERSLAVQLSDGSVASAHRSSGLTWTAGVECAFFTHAARFFQSRDADKSAAAREAARRALSSLARWQREGGYYSPAEHCLPPGYRVGFERYSTEANHGTLPMAALAVAIMNGFDDEPLPSGSDRAPLVRIEHDPTYRAIAHRGPYSVHFNALPSPQYDGFGIVDLTFGPNRFLHFMSSVTSLTGGGFINLGLAYKEHQVEGELTLVARKNYTLLDGFKRLYEPGCVGFSLEGRCKGEAHTYAASVSIDRDGVQIEEATPGLVNFKTLLLPYLRDPGTGTTTEVSVGETIRLIHGSEEIEIAPEQSVYRVIHLPYGYENRRGLCGLLRIDFEEAREGISYQVHVVR